MNKNPFNLTENITLPDQIYVNIETEKGVYRLYDTRPNAFSDKVCDNMNGLSSELAVFFKFMSTINLDIIYINFDFKNPILLNDLDLNCFKKNKPEVILTDNWLKIREQQSEDLMLLFNNFFFESVLLSPDINNNIYNFNLLLIFKKEVKWENIKNLNFKFIKINNFYKIYSENITHQFFKLFLNFPILEKYCFKEVYTSEWKEIHDTFNSDNYTKEFTNSVEYINYENYLEVQEKFFNKSRWELRKENDYTFFLYSNLYYAKMDEKNHSNYNIFLKNCFSQLTILWCFVNYEWKDEVSNVTEYGYSYPVNEMCYATESMYSTSSYTNDYYISLEEYAKIHTINDYNFTCTFDILSCDFPGYEPDEFGISFNEINYNILSYKTCYKSFLEQNKIK